MSVTHRKTIDDPRAPPRLRGKVIEITVNETDHQLQFRVDVPDDLTAQEKGYLDWSIGEYVEWLRKRMPDVVGYRIPPKAGE